MRIIPSFVAVFILLTACYTNERNCKAFQTGSFIFYSIVDGDTLSSRFVRNDSIEVDYFFETPWIGSGQEAGSTMAKRS